MYGGHCESRGQHPYSVQQANPFPDADGRADTIGHAHRGPNTHADDDNASANCDTAAQSRAADPHAKSNLNASARHSILYG